MATLTEAVHTCFARKYARFEGRAAPSEFWWLIFFNVLASNGLAILDIVLGLALPETGAGLLSALYSLAALIPTLAVTVRRLHDTGRTGWWALLILIPLGIFVLIVLCILNGDASRANRFGVRDDDSCAPTTASSDDPVETLEKLAQLRDAGLLNENEFNAKKAEILGRL